MLSAHFSHALLPLLLLLRGCLQGVQGVMTSVGQIHIGWSRVHREADLNEVATKSNTLEQVTFLPRCVRNKVDVICQGRGTRLALPNVTFPTASWLASDPGAFAPVQPAA